MDTKTAGTVTQTIADILRANGDDFKSARAEIVRVLRQLLEDRRAEIADSVALIPRDAAKQRHEYTRLTDSVVCAVFDLVIGRVLPVTNPTTSERINLIAVGGYGRGEMAPYSDVDLLFLIPYRQTGWHESVIETVLYLLWDLGLKVGQSVRTITENVNLARDDITIRTSLLEMRHLAGDSALMVELEETLRRDLFEGTVVEFLEGKLEEREARHNKSGNTRYVLEPNVKEAKGGLRDLQTLYWLGKYITGADTPEELEALGFLDHDEHADFREAEDFLWMVRIHLHLIAKRASDGLSFDMQVEVARILGYQDRDHRRGVEYFMQDYFRAARLVGELTRVFLTELETRHIKPNRMREFFRRSMKLPDAFRDDHGRINFVDDSALVDDPLNILRIFVAALETGALIHPHAFRLMVRHSDLIDESFRTSKEANRIFMSLLLDFGNPERVLRRMNELGLLAAFLPAWAHIDAMMQFNMYHSYTVDEHTIRCLANLSAIEHGDLVEELPVASGILSRGVNRKVIYAALLFHDIGKGVARPHEEVGAEIARDVAPRLGLEPFEVELVSWLVRHHLEMSDAAQKRDIADPKTITDFAMLVGDHERLDLLTVLTVCDIRAVGPTTWNNWKAVLLRQLHRSTSDALDEGGVESAIVARQRAAVSALQAQLADWSPENLARETDRHYTDYWLGLDTSVHVEFAKMLSEEIAQGDLRLTLTPDYDRDATRASLVMADHPGLFARLCGAFSLSGANIVDARTYTSSDGIATAVFWVQDNEGGTYELDRQVALRRNVTRIMHGEVLASTALAQRSKFKRRERQFKVPTRVTFDNDGSKLYTIIVIDTRDRLGLLFDLTRAIAAANISISSAIIATYGEQAVDSFYVKDIFGLKIHSKAKQEAIAKRIEKAIEDGYQEAMA